MKVKTVSPDSNLFIQFDATPKCSGPFPSVRMKRINKNVIFTAMNCSHFILILNGIIIAD